MRVVILNELYAPHIGGQEYRANGLAAALVDLGHTVSILCVNHDTEKLPDVAVGEAGERILRYRPRGSYIRNSGQGRSLTAVIGYCRWSRKLLFDMNADLVFVMQWPLVHALTTPPDSAIFDWCETRTSWRFRVLAKFTLRRFSTHTAVSPVLAAQLNRTVPSAAVSWVPSGAQQPPSGYRRTPPPVDAPIRVLFLGRLAHHKRPALVLDAALELAGRGAEVELVFAGTGPCLSDIADRAQGIGWIDVRGEVTEGTKQELLAWADVLVLPSIREGLPNVIAEAAKFGVPSVVTRSDENHSAAFVESMHCGLATGSSAAEIADGIQIARVDPQIAIGVEQVAVRFDWAASVDSLLNLADRR